MDRREFLRTGACVSGVLSAGCIDAVTSLARSRSQPREPPVVEDRPDAVYYPTHTEGMEMVGMARAEGCTIALSYSYPHRFWTVTDDETERVPMRDDDSIHLMVSVWDTDTNVVVPFESPNVELTRDGEVVDRRSLWPMLSQSMGFHFGDNVSLPGDGTYTAAIDLASIATRRTGAFADRFDDPVSVEIEFDYRQEMRNDLDVTELLGDSGREGAAPPMEMDMPLATVPHELNLPGTGLGEATSGDAVFLATEIENGAYFDADGQTYLAISPRTPYHLFPLPFMSLSATVTRGSETVFDDSLRSAIDPVLKYHYGAALENLESGDEITVAVESPPQVSRHEGYETAFLTMPDVEFTV